MSADRMRTARWAAAVLLPLVLGACSWFTDFKRTPVVTPWETANDSVPPRANPQLSVPVQGAMVPGFLVSYRAMPDSFAQLANPVAADARSLDNGRKLYQINCMVCHGQSGRSMPLMKYGAIMPPPIGQGGRALPDGYVWGIIRNGRGAMPPYVRIEEQERWDVVNYLTALRGGSADTTLAGLPGETGATLPLASMTGPTRPAPYFKHIGMQAGAPGNAVAGNAAPAAAPGADSAAALPGAAPGAGATAGATTAARPAAPGTDTTRNRGRQP